MKIKLCICGNKKKIITIKIYIIEAQCHYLSISALAILEFYWTYYLCFCKTILYIIFY